MNKMQFCCGTVLLTALTVFAVNPESGFYDPDDQLRYIDELDYGVYDHLVADGFNTLIQSTHFSSLKILDDPQANAYERGKARAFLETLKKCERDHINFIENIPGWGHQTQRFQPKYPIIDKSGKEVPKGIEASNPEFLKEIAALSKVKATEAASYSRAVVGVSVASEVRAHSQPSHTPAQRARYLAETGREVPPEVDGRIPPCWKTLPSFPKDRVIETDYPLYAYYRWFWTTGDGWNSYNSMIAKQFDEALGKRPHLTLYSPVLRAPQFWGSGGKITHFHDWSYANPYPVVIAQIAAEQQAMAREDGRGFFSMVQAISWRRDIAGPDKTLTDKGVTPPAWTKEWPKTKFPTMPPDLMLEGIWMAWLHRCDGVGFHGWNSIYDGRPLGLPDGENVYAFTHPGTQKVISNLFHTVGIPLGPYFKAVPERKPQVAILISAASELFGGEAAWDFRGQPHQYGMIATLAGLSPYVIYDDEIARDGIPPSVKVMLLRKCPVLTRTTYEQLVAFKKRGGKILADDDLAPALKADGKLPLPAYSWENPKWFEDFGRGVMFDAAVELRKAVGALCELPVTCDNRDIVLHIRQAGSADLVFAVNDARKFGDYVGQWKRCLEEGIPAKGVLTVNRRAGAVYDIVRHTSVPFKAEGRKTQIPLEYTTCDGRALLVCERPLKPLKIRRADGDAIRVETADTDVMIPIGVFPANGRPRYGVLKDGKWTRRVPGGEVKVQNLATGEWFAESAFSAVKLADAKASKHATPITDNIKGRENTEWSVAYSYHVTDYKNTLPRVLLVGDSICNGYQYAVAGKLEGKATVSYWASSYSIVSPMYWRLFEAYLTDLKYDIVHFNNGLHSSNATDSEWQNGLKRAFRLIREKQPKAQIVWVASTPTGKPEITEKVKRMNALAESVAQKEGVTLRDDLFTLLDPLPREQYWRDPYHFKPEGVTIQADAIAACITNILNAAVK